MVIYAVPGVPHEMEDMLRRAVLPDLQARDEAVGVIASRVLKTWGESESGLDERLRDVIDRLDDDGDADAGLPGAGLERARGPPDDPAARRGHRRRRAGRWEAEVRAVLGPLVFGADGDSMESVVLDALRARGLTLGLAESLTGGLVAARLTAIAGASDVLRGLDRLLRQRGQVRPARRHARPVVNEQAAAEMAVGARGALGADVGLALTGVAGPTEQDGVPVGTVCVGLALPVGGPHRDPAARPPARAGPPVRRHQRARPRASPAARGPRLVGCAGRLP